MAKTRCRPLPRRWPQRKWRRQQRQQRRRRRRAAVRACSVPAEECMTRRKGPKDPLWRVYDQWPARPGQKVEAPKEGGAKRRRRQKTRRNTGRRQNKEAPKKGGAKARRRQNKEAPKQGGAKGRPGLSLRPPVQESPGQLGPCTHCAPPPLPHLATLPSPAAGKDLALVPARPSSCRSSNAQPLLGCWHGRCYHTARWTCSTMGLCFGRSPSTIP